MSAPSDLDFPSSIQPLPELEPSERLYAHKGLRLVKSGRLFEVRFRLHEKRGRLVTSWSEDGDGTLCK